MGKIIELNGMKNGEIIERWSKEWHRNIDGGTWGQG